jgi:2-methylcitrate dehydratase PrpD
MNAINRLADFVIRTDFNTLPDGTRNHLKMHLLDTIGAMLAGPQTQEGRTIGKLAGQLGVPGKIPVIGYPFRASLLSAVMLQCAATRCTEVDDIHLESCITPGSVVIPAALSLANAGYLSDPEDFLAAVAVGYELPIRIGLAINGPRALYRGIWPTYLSAALGSAAVAARALKLNSLQAASAISTAFLMSTGISGRFRSAPSARCLTLGVAAQNGIIAAFSARAGFAGDDSFLDRTGGRIWGSKVSMEKLTESLGERFLIDETGMKPYPIARQALAAVEGFREIMAAHNIDPESIQEVCVRVPRQVITLIDHPKIPVNRQDSIVSVQYQMALAAFSPQGLFDARRETAVKNRRMMDLMEKIQVKSSTELGRCYPSIWPAKVEVKTAGRKVSSKIFHPKGDYRNRFTWEELKAKFKRLAGPAIGAEATEQLPDLVRELEANTNLRQLLKLLTV